MKIKLFAFVLLSAALSLAQAATPTKPKADDPSDTKAQAPHCQKMMESKMMDGCCMHHDAAASDEKGKMACCQDKDKTKDGKDAMSCMHGDKDKSAAACADGKCPGADDKSACCGKSDKDEHMAMACCGGSEGHCGMGHHDHGDMSK